MTMDIRKHVLARASLALVAAALAVGSPLPAQAAAPAKIVLQSQANEAGFPLWLATSGTRPST